MEKLTPQAIIDSFAKELGDGFVGGSVYELSLIHISEPTRPY